MAHSAPGVSAPPTIHRRAHRARRKCAPSPGGPPSGHQLPAPRASPRTADRRPGPPAHRARTGRAFAVPRVQAAHRARHPRHEHSRHDRRHRAGQYGGAGPGERRKTGPGLPPRAGQCGGAGQGDRRKAGPGRPPRAPTLAVASSGFPLASVSAAAPAQAWWAVTASAAAGARAASWRCAQATWRRLKPAPPRDAGTASLRYPLSLSTAMSRASRSGSRSGAVRPVAEPLEQRAGERAGRVRYGHQDAPSAASAKLTTLTSARHAAKSQLNRLENYESSVPGRRLPYRGRRRLPYRRTGRLPYRRAAAPLVPAGGGGFGTGRAPSVPAGGGVGWAALCPEQELVRD